MQTEHVVSTQLILYGLSWLIAAIVMPQERKCLANWAAYGLLQGLSGFLFVQSGQVFGNLLLTLAFILNTLGFYAAMRGIEAFSVDTSRLDRWLGGVIIIAIAALLLIPMTTGDHTQIRRAQGLTYSAVNVLILLGSAPYLWKGLRKSHSRLSAGIGLLPGMLMGLTGLAQIVIFALSIQIDASQVEKLNSDNLLSSMLATGLFNLAFIFLFISQVVRRLRDSSQRDHLTGLFNRRECDERLKAIWQMHRRKKMPFSIALIDLDHFKKINDSRGHSFGDECIIQAATYLKTEVRQYDVIGRWGGEEFILIMPDTTIDDAVKLCNRLREGVSQFVISTLGQPLTVSIGVSSTDSADTTDGPSEIFIRADKLLYKAKDAGRNCVVAA